MRYFWRGVICQLKYKIVSKSHIAFQGIQELMEQCCETLEVVHRND